MVLKKKSASGVPRLPSVPRNHADTLQLTCSGVSPVWFFSARGLYDCVVFFFSDGTSKISDPRTTCLMG